MQNGGCFYTAFAGSIPQRVLVCNLIPLVYKWILSGIQTGVWIKPLGSSWKHEPTHDMVYSCSSTANDVVAKAQPKTTIPNSLIKFIVNNYTNADANTLSPW